MGMDGDDLNDTRWDLVNFGPLSNNSGSNLANFTSQENLNTLKIVYNHAYMSV